MIPLTPERMAKNEAYVHGLARGMLGALLAGGLDKRQIVAACSSLVGGAAFAVGLPVAKIVELAKDARKFWPASWTGLADFEVELVSAAAGVLLREHKAAEVQPSFVLGGALLALGAVREAFAGVSSEDRQAELDAWDAAIIENARSKQKPRAEAVS